jgi:hypothetical protein
MESSLNIFNRFCNMSKSNINQSKATGQHLRANLGEMSKRKGRDQGRDQDRDQDRHQDENVERYGSPLQKHIQTQTGLKLPVALINDLYARMEQFLMDNNHIDVSEAKHTPAEKFKQIEEWIGVPFQHWDAAFFQHPHFTQPSDRALNDLVAMITDKYLQPRATYASEYMDASALTHSLRQLQDDPAVSFKTLHVIDPSKLVKSLVSIEMDVMRYEEKKGPAPPRYYGLITSTSEISVRESHWVALLIDMEQKTLEFYDSFGKDPQEEYNAIQAHMRDVLGLFSKSKSYHLARWKNDQRWKQRTSTMEMQHSGVDCGMFSLWYLTSRVRLNDMEETITQGFKQGLDKNGRMCALKKQYFRPPIPNQVVIPDDDDDIDKDNATSSIRPQKRQKQASMKNAMWNFAARQWPFSSRWF